MPIFVLSLVKREKTQIERLVEVCSITIARKIYLNARVAARSRHVLVATKNIQDA